jgi:hypothetical protein
MDERAKQWWVDAEIAYQIWSWHRAKPASPIETEIQKLTYMGAYVDGRAAEAKSMEVINE